MNPDRRFFLLGSTALASCATAGSLNFKGKKVAVSGVPATVTPPNITGSFVTGATATCATGTYTNSPTSIARQWKRSGVAIGGATGLTYVFQVADEGLPITVAEIPSNAFGAGPVATSTAVFPTPAGSVPIVAPSGSYNGTPKSGGTPPSDPTRTTAKPAIHWVVPSRRRFTSASNLILGVDADAGGTVWGGEAHIVGTALTIDATASGSGPMTAGMVLTGAGVTTGQTVVSGSGSTWVVSLSQTLSSTNMTGLDPAKHGVKQVDWWVEGGTVTTPAPQFFTWVENGITKTSFGYFIQLQKSDFAAGGNTGEARIYATAVPNDPTMQSRVIGFDDSASNNVNGNYAMSVFPRNALNDFSYTVSTANSGTSPNFKTIDAAIARAVTDSAEAPLILITQNSTPTVPHEITSAGSSHTGGKGRMTIMPDTGITAWLGRAATYAANGVGNDWVPGWEGIEFRGPNLFFNQLNWNFITFSTASAPWFNNMTCTNSIGTRDTFYWNGNEHPGFGPNVMGHWDNSLVQYGTSHGPSGTGVADMYYVMNCNLYQMASSQFSGTQYLYKNYERDISTAFVRDLSPGITITYTNPGGHTTATVTKTTGGTAGGPGNFILNVDGSAVQTIAYGDTYASTVYTYAGLAAAINAFGNGWSATALNGRGGMNIQTMNFGSGGLGTGGQPFTNQNCFGVAYSPNCAYDAHASWWQAYAGPDTRENTIIRATVTRDYGDLGGAWFETAIRNGPGDTNFLEDIIIKCNICQMIDPDNGAGTDIQIGTAFISHMVFENNTHNVPQTRDNIKGVNLSTYCSIRNNITGHEIESSLNPSVPAVWDGCVPWTNNIYAESRFGDINGDDQGSSGNVAYVNNASVTAPWIALFVDSQTAGNYLPMTAGLLLANQYTSINTYDALGHAFAASDVAGAWSKNSTAPTWPF